jgi:hypothetical protein
MPELSARGAARAAVVGAIGLLILVLALEWLPRLTRSTHVITSTPVPTGMREAAEIPLAPGQTACMDGIAVAPESRRLKLGVDPRLRRLTTPLQVTLRGPGYSETVRVAPADDHVLVLPVETPARTAVAQLCVRNAGDEATALAATADPRVLQRTRAAVDGGAPMGAAFLATFTEGETSTPLSRTGATIEQTATFSALGPWAFWIALPLLALGVPALLLRAFYVSAREDDDPGAGT